MVSLYRCWCGQQTALSISIAHIRSPWVRVYMVNIRHSDQCQPLVSQSLLLFTMEHNGLVGWDGAVWWANEEHETGRHITNIAKPNIIYGYMIIFEARKLCKCGRGDLFRILGQLAPSPFSSAQLGSAQFTLIWLLFTPYVSIAKNKNTFHIIMGMEKWVAEWLVRHDFLPSGMGWLAVPVAGAEGWVSCYRYRRAVEFSVVATGIVRGRRMRQGFAICVEVR